MTQIPRAALILGLAGLIPFLFGTATLFSTALAQWALQTLGPRFVGPYVQIFYGTIILAFMSGVIWGFATKATGTVAAAGYTLSVIPALWAFFMVGDGARSASLYLAVGFIGLLGIDFLFWKHNLAPSWWMHLRVLLTVIVTLCLILSANA